MNRKPYHIELCYGYQECESGIYHSFVAIDPLGQHDDEKMARKLSATLDTTPDDASFKHNSMQILLPAEVIERIRVDAVNDFLTSMAEGADGSSDSQGAASMAKAQPGPSAEVYQHDQPRMLRPLTVRMCETVFDITLNAQHLCETKRIAVEDSRELFSSILQWAREFEAKYFDEQGRDYIGLIDEYAEDVLLAQYGALADTHANKTKEETN